MTRSHAVARGRSVREASIAFALSVLLVATTAVAVPTVSAGQPQATPAGTGSAGSAGPGQGGQPHPGPTGTASPYTTTPLTSATPYVIGDVFASLTNASVVEYSPTGTLRNTLSAGATGEDTGSCFDGLGNLYVTNFASSNMTKFDSAGSVLTYPWAGSSFGTENPESCLVDTAQHVYVGSVDSGALRRFDTAGNLLNTWHPAAQNRGIDWIDLAADQCTLLYTSEGSSIKAFNVCTGAQLSDFATGLPGTCYALRILQSGQVAVACTSEIALLTAAGAVSQTYSAASIGDTGGFLFAFNVTPDNSAFWTADYNTGGIWEVSFSSGAVLEHFTAGQGVHGLAVFGEAGTAPAPSAQESYGTGSGIYGANWVARRREPVNTATGNYASQVIDLSMPGRGIPFVFVRTYNSLDSSVGPLGPGWRFSFGAHLSFDGSGNATFFSDDGAQYIFDVGSGGAFTPLPGTTATLKSVTGGYQLTRQDQLVYQFDSGGNLTSQTDRNGNTLTFAYTSGQLTTITDTVGRVVTLTYTSGKLTKLTDPIGRSVSYAYNGAGQLASVTDVRNGLTSYAYDASGKLATVVDQNNHTLVTNTYDPTTGRVTQQLDALGDKTTFTWNATTTTSTMTDARTGTWTDVYSNGLLASSTDPLGHTRSYAYDSHFNRVSVTDPNGFTTTLSWDASGNLLSATDPAPLSFVETFTYDSANDLLSHADGRGETTSYTYDGSGNLTKITYPDTTTSSFTYFSGGLRQSATDQRAKTTTYAYDAQANLNKITSPLGEITTMTYDGVGRMLSRVDPRGNVTGGNPAAYTTSFGYDAASHLTSVTDPLSHVTSTLYDPAGNRSSVTDPNSHTTSYGYDAANHLTTVTDAATKVTTYTYDAVGNIATRKDANGHITSYAYDLAEHLTSTTDPAGHVWSLTYDPAGNVATRTDANAKTTTYTYDAINRLASITYASPSTHAVTFGYDGDNNRTSMSDGAGTETYGYDPLNRLTGVTRGTDTFTYVPDPAGNLLSRTYPDGTVTSYTYDDDGRLASASFPVGASAADTIAPSTPAGLTAAPASASQINIAWSASTDDVAVQGYRIYRNGTYLSTVGPVGSTSFSDTGLSASTTYAYTVSAIDPAGNESAQSASASANTNPTTDTTPPSVPTGLTASAVAWNQVNVSWTASTDNVGVTSYTIYRNGAKLSVVSGTTTSFTDRSTLPGNTYGYTVSASDAAGNSSPQSNARADNTPTTCTGCTTTTLMPTADSYVSSQHGNTNYGTSKVFKTYYSTFPNVTENAYLMFSGASLPAGQIEAATLSLYDVSGNYASYGAYQGGSTSTSWTETGITYNNAPPVSYSTCSFINPALVTGQWNVASLDGSCISRSTFAWQLAGPAVEITYGSRESTTPPQLQVQTFSDATAPSVPTGLWVIPAGSRQMNLGWIGSTDNVGVQGYKIYRNGTYLSTVGLIGSTSFTDTGLNASTSYTYTVSAVDGAGNESAQSTAISATMWPTTDTTAPSIPSNASATAVAWNQVNLSWTASTDNVGVTSYTVYRGGTKLSVVSGSTAAFVDHSTVASTAYSYTVSASDAAGNASAQSSAASVTTPAAPASTATVTYAYDPASELTAASGPDGVTEHATYDIAGRLLEIANTETSGTLSRFTYGLDAAGNRTELTTSVGTTYLTYDALDRLTGACTSGSCVPPGGAPLACLACTAGTISRPAATIVPNPSDTFTSFTYDPLGNRATMVNYLGTTTYTYDAADRLTSAAGPGGTTSYTYDPNGNELTAGSATYTYDLADRMISGAVGGTTQSYTWSGDGVRLSAATGTGAATTSFLVDRNLALPTVAIERDGTGSIVRREIYGASRIALLSATTVPTYEHHDGLGSVTDLTNASGASQVWSEYAPFGSVRTAGATNGAATDPFGFTGQYLDSPTGLLHLRARQYDSGTGRFLSTDPVPSPMEDAYVGSYVYAGNNPTRYMDPSGRCVGPLIIVCIGVGAGIVGYVVGTVISNVAQGHGDDPLRGANPVDLTISGVAGGLSGGAGGLIEGTFGKVVINAIIGFDATLTSMAVGGRSDPSELVIGTALGGVGGGIDVGGGAQGFARGVAANGAVNALLTALQNLLVQIASAARNAAATNAPGTSVALSPVGTDGK